MGTFVFGYPDCQGGRAALPRCGELKHLNFIEHARVLASWPVAPENTDEVLMITLLDGSEEAHLRQQWLMLNLSAR